MIFSKNSKKWRCQLSPKKCAKMRENNKLSHLGRKEISTESHMRRSEAAKKSNVSYKRRGKTIEDIFGFQTAKIAREKMRAAHKINPRTHTIETKNLLSNLAKARGTGGYIKGSGRGKKGWYKGIFCDSSWELAYVIYCLDHNIDIQRNTQKRKYEYLGRIKNYIPDFIVSGELTEIKGFSSQEWLAKIVSNPDVRVLYEKDLDFVFEYVIDKYGKDFIKLYENTRKE